MLSDSVLCAIQIVDCLSSCHINARGVKAMMDEEINRSIDAPTHLIKDVKSKMRRGSLIKRTTTGNQLCRSAEEITLMDLYNVIHLGIPLGSVIELKCRDLLSMQNVKRYTGIKIVEDHIRGELKEYLESIKISSLISDSTPLLYSK